MTETAGLELLVVGIDGCCWEYLQPLLDAGKCPNLAALIARGTRGCVNSTILPLSPMAWSSFITGRTPARHGVFEWRVRRPGGLLGRPVCGLDRHGVPFWDYVGASGRRIGIAGIPVTHPAPAVNGFLFSGFDALPIAGAYSWPPKLFDLLNGPLQHRGRVLLPQNAHLAKSSDGSAEARFDEALTDACVSWSKDVAVQALVVNYMSFDHLNHYCPDDAVVFGAIESADRQIGRLIDALHPSTTVVISDHGTRRNHGSFALSRILREQGLVEYSPRPLGDRNVYALAKRWAEMFGGRRGFFERAAARGIYEILRRLPQSLYSLTCRLGSAWHDGFTAIAGNEERRSAVQATINGAIYFRKTDRAAVDWRERRAHLSQMLRQFVTPETGKPFFRLVADGESLFAGDFLDQAPDLVALGELDDYELCLTEGVARRESVAPYFSRPARYNMFGGHRQLGIYVADGAPFPRRHAGPTVDIHLLPQIILHLLGIAVPEDFEGAFPADVFTPGFLRDRPPTRQPPRAAGPTPQPAAISREAVAAVLQRLGDLEYVE